LGVTRRSGSGGDSGGGGRWGWGLGGDSSWGAGHGGDVGRVERQYSDCERGAGSALGRGLREAGPWVFFRGALRCLDHGLAFDGVGRSAHYSRARGPRGAGAAAACRASYKKKKSKTRPNNPKQAKHI
jgi:hypothetical protein